MRHGLVVSAIALALGIGSTSAGAQHGTIAGTALDSLRGNWLTGALVTVEGVGRSAISDSAGDFRIDSVPAGTHRLAVFHPLLDTIALSLMTPHFEVVADSTTDVLVAVPSPSTMLALKCGREAEAAVIGQVSRADDPEPPARAVVMLRWVEIQAGRGIGIRQTDRALSVPVAADGSFRMCHIEPGVFGEVMAIAGTDTSASYAASFEEWPVLVIASFVLPGADVQRVAERTEAEQSDEDVYETPIAALRVGRATISGIVVDPGGSPIAGARVSLTGAMGASLTGADGRFTLTNQPSGSGILMSRKIGLAMSELPVVVSANRRNEYTIQMSQTVQSLAEVVVRAHRQISLERVGFYSRQQGKRGSRYIGPEQMEQMANRTSLATILNGASNLTYRQGRILGRYRPTRAIGMAGGNVMMQGGHSCVTYIVDGQLWRQYGPDDSPVEYILPHEVAAIEVYRSGDVPLDVPFASYTQGCETVVIWTKRRLRTQ